MINFKEHTSPVLFHFNASGELEVANELPYYTPPAFLQQFQRDMAFLPLLFGHSSDYLLAEEEPHPEFLHALRDIKADLPQVRSYALMCEQANKIKHLAPWSWSPTEHAFLKPFKAHCGASYQQRPNAEWQPAHKALYSRETARDVLQKVLEMPGLPDLMPVDFIPLRCESLQEVKEWHVQWGEVVVKAPWSTSGRGIIMLQKGHMSPTYERWITGMIQAQGFVMVEPRLQKVLDISFHYELQAGKAVHYLGQASFATTERGQYIGNYLEALPTNLSEEVQAFLSPERVQQLAEALRLALQQSALYAAYSGVLGVDTLLYQQADGSLRWYPCMEINLRTNMGTLALAIRSLLHPEAQGMWQVERFSKTPAFAYRDFHVQMQAKHPRLFADGKMLQGYLPLSDPFRPASFGCYLVAGA